MKRVFDFKKPLVWILIAVLAVSAVAAVFLFKKQPTTEVSDALDACIVSAIRAEYGSDYTEGKYPAVAYTVLDVKEKKNTTTVYGVMMYREYTATTEGELKTWGTIHYPFALTAKAAGDAYELVECLWPEQGAAYEKSVKKLFPSHLKEKVTNFQRYYGPNDLACNADAAAHIADADKYTVLQSERENVWLAYQKEGTHCYVVATGNYNAAAGYNATGTYTVEDNLHVFTFGTCKMALEMSGEHRLYSTEHSEAVPTSWESFGDIVYLDNGTRFSPVVRGDTALVGDTLTISGGMTHMSDDEIKKMFGYVPNNTDYTDGGDKPYYLPVKVFTSRPQLDVLLSQHMEDSVWTDLKQDTFARFDEAFFENNTLVMTYYKAGTYQAEPSVASYVYIEDGTCLSVRLQVDMPEASDTAVGQWLLFSGISKIDMEGVTTLEAYVEETATAKAAAPAVTGLSFTGTVTQVEGNSVLLENTNASQFSNGVWVELGDAELDPMVGETYAVTYEDVVMLSMPPRIIATSIRLKD